jgi:hypothetical protein
LVPMGVAARADTRHMSVKGLGRIEAAPVQAMVAHKHGRNAPHVVFSGHHARAILEAHNPETLDHPAAARWTVGPGREAWERAVMRERGSAHTRCR